MPPVATQVREIAWFRMTSADAPRSLGTVFIGDGEMAARCRALDWAATPLGPVERWSSSLRTAVGIVLASRHPMFLWWGADLVQIYNDAYRPSFGEGGRHPGALGMRGAEFWTDIWPIIGPQIEGVMTRGEATWHEDHLVPIVRNGRLEEVYWTYGYSPVYDDDGTIGGTLVVCTETTPRIQAEREREPLLRAMQIEHSHLEAVFRQSPSFLAVLRGPDNVFELVNGAYEQIIGHGREVVGKPLLDALPETRGQGFDDYLGHVRRTGESLVFRDLPVLLHRQKGAPLEERFLDVTYLPLVEADGSDLAVIAHGTDVTEQVEARRAAERALAEVRASEAKFRALVDAIPTLAWMAQPDGYIDWYNARWYEYTGTTASEMEGWGWQSVHDPETLPSVLARWRASIGTGEPFEMTFPLRGADGEFRPFLTRIVPARDAEGHVVRWFGINTNIEPERRLRHAAEEANRAKSEFLAVMSHELRTPLNAIDGYAALLELGIRGPLTDAQREDIGRIRRSERHLLGLIDGVLSFARIEAGAERYHLEDVSIDEILITSESLTAPQVRQKGLTLERMSGDPALRVRADREKMQQILLNLLSNAIKFTAPGGRLELRYVAQRDVAQPVIRITVTDTGVGIDSKHWARIFEPFVQVSAPLTRAHEGTGLGLAISRDLARGMGGDLTVESTPGVGSTFELRLPLATRVAR